MGNKSIISQLLRIWSTDTREDADSVKPKPRKKTKAERRREESDRIWAEIMRDEEELDDDEL
ncbi:MAG: hypothetical protein IIY52_05745 [Solobacterium sp.]|nr:hypothetical protein [Solobacterium sp.]